MWEFPTSNRCFPKNAELLGAQRRCLEQTTFFDHNHHFGFVAQTDGMVKTSLTYSYVKMLVLPACSFCGNFPLVSIDVDAFPLQKVGFFPANVRISSRFDKINYEEAEATAIRNVFVYRI